MKIIVLDTETIGLEKAFVYDLGYIVYDTDTNEVIKQKDYVISQVWKNKPLMETAYYYKKKPIYEERLKSGYSKMVGWRQAMRFLSKDVERYGVTKLLAYNSRFDHNAFNVSCKMFGGINPFDTCEEVDIMKEIKSITDSEEYREFCHKHGFLTRHKPKPRPQRKAETLYRYMTGDTEYNEEHTGLEDSKIELAIWLFGRGA